MQDEIAAVKAAWDELANSNDGILSREYRDKFKALDNAIQQLPDAPDCEDTARLDWLESHNTTWWWQCKIGGDLTSEVTLRSNANEGHRTAREAIDAAISAERKP